jgi:hypothetical protein
VAFDLCIVLRDGDAVQPTLHDRSGERVLKDIQVAALIVSLNVRTLPSASAALTDSGWYEEAGLSMNHQFWSLTTVVEPSTQHV